MNRTKLDEALAIARIIATLESASENLDSIRLKIDSNYMCPRVLDNLSAEAQADIDEKMAEIREIISRDINSRLDEARRQFDDL